MCFERRKGFCFLCRFIVPMIKEKCKNPLSKLIIIWVACFYLSIPIIGKAHDIELFTKSFDILFGCYRWMLSSLDGVLFGWQTKCVVAHGMQHIKTV